MSAPVAEFFPTRSTRHHSARAYRDLADWLASLRLKGRSDRTLDDYERTIAALIEWKDVDASDYTLDDLVHFVLLKYGATPGARVRMSHLKGFFTFLFIRERIRKNIGAQLEMPRKATQKVIDVFSDAELALIYAADPLACLLCETGIRKSEARNLKRGHINLAPPPLTLGLERDDELLKATGGALGAGTPHRVVTTGPQLVIYNGKGDKDRIVPMTPRATQVVADMDLTEGLNPTDHLWPTRPGGGEVLKRRDPISNTAMQKWWADEMTGVLARAGVVYRNMHVTRHTFATRLIQRGARIENVQLLLGHSSIQTTVNLYAHLDVEDARADLKLLELYENSPIGQT